MLHRAPAHLPCARQGLRPARPRVSTPHARVVAGKVLSQRQAGGGDPQPPGPRMGPLRGFLARSCRAFQGSLLLNAHGSGFFPLPVPSHLCPLHPHPVLPVLPGITCQRDSRPSNARLPSRPHFWRSPAQETNRWGWGPPREPPRRGLRRAAMHCHRAM